MYADVDPRNTSCASAVSTEDHEVAAGWDGSASSLVAIAVRDVAIAARDVAVRDVYMQISLIISMDKLAMWVVLF